MKFTTILSLLIVFGQSCHPAKNCVEHIKPDCICTMQYDPVCGCNNKTYGNACAAECAGIKTYTKGACPQDATPGLENMVWQLVSFSGNPPQPVPADVTISIKFEGGKMDGHGGCNNVGATYILDGNSLKISGIRSTKMFCQGASDWENRFLKVLEKSASYTISGETLEIACGSEGSLIFRQNWKKRKGE